jgi:hypothetical protein
MPKRLTGEKLTERNALIQKWLKADVHGNEIKRRVEEKYGIGIHTNTLRAIRESIGKGKPYKGRKPGPKPGFKRKAKPKSPAEETALVLSSPSGLVPARDLSARLRALISHVADAMIEEGVLTVTVDGRYVTVTHIPEETAFEV